MLCDEERDFRERQMQSHAGFGMASSENERAPAATASLPVRPSTPPCPVEGLLFDVGDVLYDATIWRRWFLQLLSRVGLHSHYRLFYCVWEKEYLARVHCGQRDYWDALREYLGSIGLAAGLIDEVIAAGHARYENLTQFVRPLPGVTTTLARLADAGLTLGVIYNCNCTAERLAGQLKQLRLGSYLKTIVSSMDVGRVMPHPAPYEAALAAMSLPAAKVGFVGHDTDELAGAQAVGMHTFAFNYDPEAEADSYLERFDELLESVPLRRGRNRAG